MKRVFLATISLLSIFAISCTESDQVADFVVGEVEALEGKPLEGKVYDITGCTYTSYKNLVMAGYQGWFNCEGDGAGRGWNHYLINGKFEPGSCSIDFWPDVSEYDVTYETAFPTADGSSYAHVYSPYDASSVDLHFKWMQEHGIDGVFMQRFVSTISSELGKAHSQVVLDNAFAAAKKYNRAIAIMYDLSGQSYGVIEDKVSEDWAELVERYGIDDNEQCPTYLRENTKPLVAIWGVGFTDREYTTAEAISLIDNIKGDDNLYSILLGVPYNWRTLTSDAESNPELHDAIKKCDIIMPWAVGRYNSSTYYTTASSMQEYDISWCRDNDILYVPCAFPGFSWRNLQLGSDSATTAAYDATPREKGAFLWKQIYGAKISGASALYVAMFDEVDEGTAIFKCLSESDVPQNGDNSFVGYEDGLESDHYLWLVGKGADWFHGDATYTNVMPTRE